MSSTPLEWGSGMGETNTSIFCALTHPEDLGSPPLSARTSAQMPKS